jgi:hypothetical protein
MSKSPFGARRRSAKVVGLLDGLAGTVLSMVSWPFLVSEFSKADMRRRLEER